MNKPTGASGQDQGLQIMFANHAFARFFDTAVVFAFVALSLTLAGATAIVGA